jgi:hypothetical protein
VDERGDWLTLGIGDRAYEVLQQEVPTPCNPMTSSVAKANNESHPDIHP